MEAEKGHRKSSLLKMFGSFKKSKKSSLSSEPRHVCLSLNIKRDPMLGYGFSMQPGPDNKGAVVNRVIPESPADMVLFVGDRLVCIQAALCDDTSFAVTKELIEGSEGTLNLGVVRTIEGGKSIDDITAAAMKAYPKAEYSTLESLLVDLREGGFFQTQGEAGEKGNGGGAGAGAGSESSARGDGGANEARISTGSVAFRGSVSSVYSTGAADALSGQLRKTSLEGSGAAAGFLARGSDSGAESRDSHGSSGAPLPIPEESADDGYVDLAKQNINERVLEEVRDLANSKSSQTLKLLLSDDSTREEEDMERLGYISQGEVRVRPERPSRTSDASSSQNLNPQLLHPTSPSSPSSSGDTEIAKVMNSPNSSTPGKLGGAAEAQRPSPDLRKSRSPYFFIGPADRETAASLLSSKDNGSYVVRESLRSPGSYAISVKFGERVFHIEITRDAEGYRISKSMAFRTIQDLINFYESNTLSKHFSQLHTMLVSRRGSLEFPTEVVVEEEPIRHSELV